MAFGESDLTDADETTAAVPVGASPGQLEGALAALPGVGAGNVEVTGAAVVPTV